MTYLKSECYQIEIARVGIDFGARKSRELYISKTSRFNRMVLIYAGVNGKLFTSPIYHPNKGKINHFRIHNSLYSGLEKSLE